MSAAMRPATGAAGTGTAPGKAAVNCRSCNGRGQVRYQQGFFSIARTCPTCQGAGSVITDPCPKCKGEGRLLRERVVEAKVPAGVEDGTRIRFTGLGEAGAFGGPAGDLYVVLHVKEHAFFEREGNDLHCVVPISFAQAALGIEIMVPTLDGEHKLKIPEGTQSGTIVSHTEQRRAGAQWARQRRSLRRGANSNAREAEQTPTRIAGRTGRTVSGGKQAAAPVVVGTREGHVCVEQLSVASYQLPVIRWDDRGTAWVEYWQLVAGN